MKRLHEVAGRTRAKALELAARYGYGQPTFIEYNGTVWVLHFEVKK